MNASHRSSRLVWRLLRQHVSFSQLAAFFLANLIGMFIVLLGFQLYRDVRSFFMQDDGVLGAQYLIIHKPVSVVDALGISKKTTFSDREIEELQEQPFCRRLGAFTASQYDVYCSMGIKGIATFGTEMFFESVPDSFVDADLSNWQFAPERPSIPIILPRSYLALYNFGFAQTRSLPKLSEGVISMIQIQAKLRGAGREERFDARVVGFSSRLNTILVPESFMRWSNERFGTSSSTSPSRLILEVGNPADEAIVSFMKYHQYELEDNKDELGRTMFLLRLMASLVIAVGALISLLSFYLLMLSIYLLVQKNNEKIRTLLLIGYSPARVALPYQMLTFIINTAVLLLALLALWAVRRAYMPLLQSMFPQLPDGSLWAALLLGVVLLLVVSLLNSLVIRRRILMIWNNKE